MGVHDSAPAACENRSSSLELPIMRLATFKASQHGGAARIGVIAKDRMLDIGDGLRAVRDDAANTFQTLRELLERGPAAMDSVRRLLDSAMSEPERFGAALHPLDSIRW